jgi:hypothetical protein
VVEGDIAVKTPMTRFLNVESRMLVAVGRSSNVPHQTASSRGNAGSLGLSHRAERCHGRDEKYLMPLASSIFVRLSSFYGVDFATGSAIHTDNRANNFHWAHADFMEQKRETAEGIVSELKTTRQVTGSASRNQAKCGRRLAFSLATLS